MGFFHKQERQPDTALPQQRAVLAIKPDGSIPPLPGEDSAALLHNTDRGLRAETYYTLGTGEHWPGEGKDGVQELQRVMEAYAEDSPVVVQTYIYLCAYNKKPLDETAFSQLKDYLQRIRDCGWSSVLRFAYEYEEDHLVGPRDRIMRRHIAQLQAFLGENSGLAHDAVTVLQLGFLGPWGEGNQSQHLHNRKRTFSSVCDMAPDGIYTQARTMKIWKQASGARRFNKLGFHNDYMVGKPHIWNTAGGNADSPDYQTFATHVALCPNDGEMPWGRAKPDADDINAGQFVLQCYEHRLSTLSLQHNYKEPGEGQPYRMAVWKQEQITPEALEALGVPYYARWFGGGTRSVFDYIRDFLGYHIQLSNLVLREQDGGATLQVLLTNYGFAAPFHLDIAQVVVLHADGTQTEYPLEGISFAQLTACAQQEGCATLQPLQTGDAVGVRLGKTMQTVSQNRYIRMANDVPVERGVHIILRRA